MRVLLVSDFYPPYIGGVEHHVHQLAHGLTERCHNVAVATLAGQEDTGVGADGEVTVHRLEGLVHRFGGLFTRADRPWAPPIPDPGLAQALRSVVKQHQPDIVHGHDWLLRSLLPVLPKSIPLVSTLHYYSRSCAKKNLLRNGAACPGPSLSRCVPCSLDHYGSLKGLPIVSAARVGAAWERRATATTVAVSSACAAGNEGSGSEGGGSEVEIVANALIQGEPAPHVADLPDEPYILYVGDLRPEKGVPVLLEAYDGIEGHKPPLVVIGGMGDLENSARSGSVRFLGERPHGQVLTAFANCMFTVVPSIWAEPFGLVVLEAMGAGKPVVASAVGGIAEIITNGEDGLLVPPGDPVALAEAMASLATNTDLVDKMGLQASATADRFSVETMVTGIERIYQRLMTS